jgi:hypothetical protein
MVSETRNKYLCCAAHIILKIAAVLILCFSNTGITISEMPCPDLVSPARVTCCGNGGSLILFGSNIRIRGLFLRVYSREAQ